MDEVTKYARSIVNGEILAGKMMIMAAERHLNDLKMQNTADFPYYFDDKLLEGFLNFTKYVPDPKENIPIPLMPWQKFALGSIVAWRDNRTGGKRFKRAIVSIARENGKTYLASILATYDFFVQSYGKSNQDILIASNTAQQTGKLFNYTKSTVEKMLQGPFKKLSRTVRPREYDVVSRKTKNQIVRISADGGQGKFDSYHATTAIFDEAGDQKTRGAFGKITSGQTGNKEAIFFMISTAYQNPNAPLREDIRIITDAIKSGERKLDDNFLGVWAQDDENEIFEPETWIKSNPLLGLPNLKLEKTIGITSERDNLLAQGKLPDFLVKTMNMWVNAKEDAAFKLSDIEEVAIDSFDIDGRDVYVGFDNSMTSDDAALAFIFPYTDENGNQKWHLYQHSFIPWHKAGSIDAKESQDGINYRQMQGLGYATITPHEKGLISNDDIYEWLLEFVDKHHLKVLKFTYDWAHNSAFIKSLEANTYWEIQAVKQGTLTLNEPTKWLQDAFVEGRVTTFKDPMMEKSLVNAIITSDNNGIKIDKNKATMKIDLVDAIIDALSEGIHYFEDYGTGEYYF
ncbi:putative phage terminase large subunit [Weissella oryzae SG25]|uniref:Putative phage terminase large subunit n=1 Tax=Weissella oryzae (strain DSM 25784 / JCM 18191 / LMG 30913 / SG25) TaxID=1329250 RepID=A0A069CWY2_WEIOS|nr:terminase TerL endonuclease subunit [Weissella oryzae]GAK31989.1 putative phage terminase large subunit [Weissella oryzae SG25]